MTLKFFIKIEISSPYRKWIFIWKTILFKKQ